MEEKGPIKVRLSTCLLIIAIIIIIVMGGYIYVITNELKNTKEVDNTYGKQNENSINLENSLQENETNSVDEMANVTDNKVVETEKEKTNTTSENESQTSNKNTTNKFTNTQIKKSIQNYLDLLGTLTGSPEGMLVKIGLFDNGKYDNAKRTDDNYINTKIKYSTYKNKMLNYVTEELFDKEFSGKNPYTVKKVDGYLYYFDGGATGEEYKVKDITIKGDYSDTAYIAQVYKTYPDYSKDLKNIAFHIDSNNGKCVIDYCDDIEF